MSTAPPPPPLATITAATKPSSFSQNLSSIGLGYAIAIALGFLVLFSTILLASYICCRSVAARRRRRRPENSNPEDDENSDAQNVVVGLDQAVINSYPKFVFTKRSVNGGANDTVCSICLCEYRESEMLRMLPDCRHCFHVMCVDSWLKLNASCPVCRSSPLPTPLSTPLQEVVPLSQYSDGRRRQ
ncbi:RING-H2 finger protein atl68 [Phtheirospermum japonicum]|uniref:RING-H2 finger protein atl68 n=1 Tax=Phtheirospermum japonicum TaxID=374723 RepID=A0A830CB40_9LAMI|nr:RING-H2 finger protein atl68 [Phtheirospermum japonicum]